MNRTRTVIRFQGMINLTVCITKTGKAVSLDKIPEEAVSLKTEVVLTTT